MQRGFSQVDVFTSTPYLGNALAVVLDGSGLSTESMQRFAAWTNLSETTFLLPPTTSDADYRVRIFTPDAELPFAGHPTLGSCHAWLEAGGRPASGGMVVQECASGLVRVRRDGDRLAFEEPPLLREGPVEEALIARLTGQLGLARTDVVDAQWADNGPGWVALLLESADAVLALRPGLVETDVGITGPHEPGGPADWEQRAFWPERGVTVEDPVTGSLAASLGGWLTRSGRARAPYVVRQGSVLGRDGRLHVTQDADGVIWVGGDVVTCVRGAVELE